MFAVKKFVSFFDETFSWIHSEHTSLADATAAADRANSLCQTHEWFEAGTDVHLVEDHPIECNP